MLRLFIALNLSWMLIAAPASAFQHSTALKAPNIPDQTMTPGHLCSETDSDFYRYRFDSKVPVCKRSVSSSRKRMIYENYGIPLSCKGSFSIDHLIPLSIGGSNADENLWPEHAAIKRSRINLENEIFAAVSDGSIKQEDAVALILFEKNHPSIIDVTLGNCARSN